MLRDFEFYNPVKIHFGKNALDKLGAELADLGEKCLFVYGRNSIKDSGLYAKVQAAFKSAGKSFVEFGGVRPNPTLSQLKEAIAFAQAEKVDCLLAVGGGSVVDFTKAIVAGLALDEGEDLWDYYFTKRNTPNKALLPYGVVLTMVGTGSEFNCGGVITNEELKLKTDFSAGDEGYARFALLDPTLTYSLSGYQMRSGIFDAMCHLLEQYLADTTDCASDYVAEGIMRALVSASYKAIENPLDYEARSNVMWCASLALNGLTSCGKAKNDWMVHSIGQAISAITDATHGMTLSAISMAYYKRLVEVYPARFARWGRAVWGVIEEDDRLAAKACLAAFEAWMKDLGVVLHASELGVTEENIPEIVVSTEIYDGGYKVLTRDEIAAILRESL